MKIESVVHEILINNAIARGDDFYLYGEVLKRVFPDIEHCMALEFFYIRHIGAPAFESVTRCRRKLQAKFPELKPDETTQVLRKVNEIVMENYAKS